MSGFHPYQAVLRQHLEERQGSIELVLLEAALDDEIKCEARHDHRIPSCSIEVTHMFQSCVAGRADRPICGASARYAYDSMEPGLRCGHCAVPIVDDWIIRPI